MKDGISEGVLFFMGKVNVAKVIKNGDVEIMWRFMDFNWYFW